MSGASSLLVDAVNNNFSRAAVGVCNGLLVSSSQGPLVITESKVGFEVACFDFCKICSAAYTALISCKVSFFKVSCRVVEKGVYVLSPCGGTHFVSNKKCYDVLERVECGDDQGGSVTLRSRFDNGGASPSVIACYVDYEAIQEFDGKCGTHSRGVGGGRDWPGGISDKSKVGFAFTERNSVDSGSFSSVDTVVGASVSKCPLVFESGRLSLNTGVELDRWRKMDGSKSGVRAFFSALQRGVTRGRSGKKNKKEAKTVREYHRMEKKVRDALQWTPVADVWCRNCVDDSRCESCQIMLDTQLMEARVRLRRAKSLVMMPDDVNCKIEGDKPRELGVVDLREENSVSSNTSALSSGRTKMDGFLTVDTAGNSANVKKKKKNSRVGETTTGVATLRNFEQCHELAATLPVHMRARLLSSDDLSHILVHDEDSAVRAFPKMRKKAQLDAAATLSRAELQMLIDEK